MQEHTFINVVNIVIIVILTTVLLGLHIHLSIPTQIN